MWLCTLVRRGTTRRAGASGHQSGPRGPGRRHRGAHLFAENLAAPQASELRNVTRQTADGLSETVTYPEVAQHAALPALHQAMVERWRG